MPKTLRQYRINDAVEVVAILQPLENYSQGGWNRRTPVVGDRGTILQISGPAESPRYFVSCTDPDSTLNWSAQLSAAEFRLVHTPCSIVALAFAHALAGGLFDAAHLMLTPGLRTEYSPLRLRSEFDDLFTSAAGSVDDVLRLGCMNEWPGRLTDDLGWAFLAIGGRGSNGECCGEAIDVIVTGGHEGLLIRAIQWGRP